MEIDFSFSIDDWMEIIKRFIDIVVGFFDHLGITIFAESEATADGEGDAE